MNRQFHHLGQKIQGKVQQLGQKRTYPNIQNLGHKIQHNGLRKAINTAGEIANVGQKARPYLYGVAHATGVGNQAIPLMHAAGQGLAYIRFNGPKDFQGNFWVDLSIKCFFFVFNTNNLLN